MDENEIKAAIHDAYYSVVRVGVPLTPDTFFSPKTIISSTWPKTPPPQSWTQFWFVAVAVAIQQAFISKGEYLPKFDGNWLQSNQAKTWNDLLQWALGNTPALGGGLIDYGTYS